MAIHIRRREFVFTLRGAADCVAARGARQQTAMPVIGFDERSVTGGPPRGTEGLNECQMQTILKP